MSTKFFQVIVEWKYKEWGLEQTYLSHHEGGRKEWTEEELALLQKVYLAQKDTRDRFVIMKTLPDRSWRAIHHVIANLGINPGKGQGRGRGVHFKRGQIEYDALSWNDIQWLQQSSLTYKSISLNEVGWTQLPASATVIIVLSAQDAVKRSA